MKCLRLALLPVLFWVCTGMAAQPEKPLPRLKVSENHRFLVQEDGKPFFYLADTAWELFHRLDRKEAAEYLKTRASQGYTVVQAVALAELDGLEDPNAYGKLPLIDKDPTRPAITPGSNPADAASYDYWDHVDYIVTRPTGTDIYVGLLPAWGRWVVKDPRKDESIFTPATAQSYGEFLGKRYGTKGVIWILGGDRTADGVEEIWRAMAKGIAIGVIRQRRLRRGADGLPPAGRGHSSTCFHNDPWLGCQHAANRARPGRKRAVLGANRQRLCSHAAPNR